MARGIPRGDDRDTAGEMSQHAAEVVGFQHSPVVSASRRFFKFSKGLQSGVRRLFLDGHGPRPYTFHGPRNTESRRSMSTPANARITESMVLDALRSVKDPDGGKDIVALGLVRDLH